MWSVFGKRPAAGGNGFPKPEWPPIQELDSIDLVGKRDDGGLDLVICVSQPLDDDPDTLDRIRRKITTYLDTIELDEFQEQMGHPPREETEIILACEHPIHPAAQAVIEQCMEAAAERGVVLLIDTSPGE